MKFKFQATSLNLIIYLTVFLFVVIYRSILLERFGFRYTDSDQSIMWSGAIDYSNGIFKEPRYYGQAYNSMLEGFLSVPLLYLSIPLNKALPIITSVLTILPFFFISLLTFLKRSPLNAIIIISLPLLLSVEYDLITCLSRGLVTGIALASLGFISLLYPHSKKSFFSLGLISILAFSLNANSVIISIPCLFYLFLENLNNRSFYIYGGLGFLTGISIHLSINFFYILNPYYNLHQYVLGFSFLKIITSISHLDLFFNDVVPLCWKNGWIFFLVLLSLSAILFKKEKYKKAITILLICFLIITTLGITKIHDANDSIFFSYSRMYLGIPIVCAIIISFLNIKSNRLFYLFLILPLACFSYKLNVMEKSIAENTSFNKNHVISIAKTSVLKNECNVLKKTTQKYNIDLVVLLTSNRSEFYNYACAAWDESFPPTLSPLYERRTWRLIEDEKKVYKNILFFVEKRILSNEFNYLSKVEDLKGAYILKNNTLPTMQVFDSMKISVRPYKD